VSVARRHIRGAKTMAWLLFASRLERVESLAELLDLPVDTQRVAALTKGQTIGRRSMDDNALAELERRLG
jgi:hypothetical protein